VRAVFTIELAKNDAGHYPTDEEIAGMMEGLGRGFRDLADATPEHVMAILNAQTPSQKSASAERAATLLPHRAPGETRPTFNYEERRHRYCVLAKQLFGEMPEVAAAEMNGVIFLGCVQKMQTLFFLTRMNEREVTFRLLHRELPRLQSSTAEIMKDLISVGLVGGKRRYDDVEVHVYERNYDRIVIKGRVITNQFLETWREDHKDTLLFIVPLLLLSPTAFVLDHQDALANAMPKFWFSQLERLSTALLTTSIVSALGLVQTWFQIRRMKLIDWSVKSDHHHHGK